MTICVTESNPNPSVNYDDSSRLSEVLLEMGYMTNADEDLWMASDDGQEQIVTGIVNGMNRYFGL